MSRAVYAAACVAGVRKGRIGNLGALEGREEGRGFPSLPLARFLRSLRARNPLAFQTRAEEASYAVRCVWC